MRNFLLFLMICAALWAKSDKLSDIPPAQEIYIDLETQKCGDDCLLELFNQGLYHSFLARFTDSNDQDVLQAYAAISGKQTAHKIAPIQGADFKIAVIIPERSIKSYARVVSDAAIAYAVRKDARVEIKFYNIGDETEQNVVNALNEARNYGISYFIAAFTQTGVEILNKNLGDDQVAYVPTIHVSGVTTSRSNIAFGGIDYKAQIEKLLEFSNGKNAAFSDGSRLAVAMNGYVEQLGGGLVYEGEIRGAQSDLKAYVNARLDGASVFLNLPIIKASLLSSQLRLYDIRVAALLSTQINYLPSIFKLTQNEDRQNLYIANSLLGVDGELQGYGAILGQDFNYNWVAYSTAVGIEHLYSMLEPSSDKIFAESIENNQIKYGVKIMKADKYDFTQAEKEEL